MGESLLNSIIKKLVLVSALLFGIAVQGVYSQSLGPGDIAFTGFNADSPDGFSVVIFESLSEGKKIHFSEGPWNGNSFDDGAGDLTWVAPNGGISSGSVLVFSGVDDSPSVNIGSISDDANMNLSSSGDVVYAYTSTIDKDEGDYTFLGTIASGIEIFNNDGANPEENGTLEGTGLTQGSTAILLPENIDNAEYIGDRSGNTPSRYRSLLNDVGTEDATGDKWDIYNGDDVAPFPPFDDTSFNIVSPPTIAFTESKIKVDESQGLVSVTIKLVEANSSAVDVDVVFLPSASTVTNGDDFASYATQTVSFSNSDGNNTTKTISITLTDDDDFEGSERAVFQLQNITTGTIISPEILTLTINDNDAPDIFINEIHADPASGIEGDADGNGSADEDDDEFVEFVNNSNSDIDISGWKFYEDALNTPTLRHTFTDGTVIPAGGALVLFADDNVQPEGSFGTAIVQSSNESTLLSLNNTGDDIELEDSSGNTIVQLSYPAAGNGQSIVRTGDSKEGTFIDHSGATGSGSDLFSPGIKVDGMPFGSKHAIAIRGTEGWRMISSPVQNATFNDLFSDLWMQGVTASDDPDGSGTLFSWSESGGGTFSAPTDMSQSLTPGKGYIVYVFEDNKYNTPGIQGGFPKIIDSDGNENSGQVSVTVTSNDAGGASGIDGTEGWNLLGNPFDTDISVDAVITALKAVNDNINANVSVWDHNAGGGNGGYVSLSSGETIAPFQAFFVRYTAGGVNGNVSFDKSTMEANTGTEFYKEVAPNAFNFDLELHGDQYFDTYSLAFNGKGTTDLDRYDAYKLFSLNPNSINLYSTLSNNRIQKNVLPRELESMLEIPLSFEVGDRESLTFRWKEIENLPSGWQLMLIDKEMNREIDLTTSQEYKFNRIVSTKQQLSNEQTLLNKAGEDAQEEPRFVLSVQPKQEIAENEEIPNSVKLNPNYPNPFNPQTTIPYELTENAEVKLTVWNMIGQKVATLVDGMVEAGSHEETWNATNMPSGIYIARFEVAGEVFTRKMTLIK